MFEGVACDAKCAVGLVVCSIYSFSSRYSVMVIGDLVQTWYLSLGRSSEPS